MGLYDYEKQLSDLQNNYANDEATNAYARFISKQRYARQRQDVSTQYQRGFPQFGARYAARGVNQGVHSGNFIQGLQNMVGDYNQGQGRLAEDEAGYDAQYTQNQSLHQGQYQQALLALQEELQRQRAAQDPFAAYRGVFQ
jgi:hypothetical protein